MSHSNGTYRSRDRPTALRPWVLHAVMTIAPIWIRPAWGRLMRFLIPSWTVRPLATPPAAPSPAARTALWSWAVFFLAAGLLFSGLGQRPFWQDEAETACLARNVLRFSLPLATDGRNVISQEEGREFDEDHLWRWSPWLPIYVSAAAFLVGGFDTAVGRFPFAVAAFLSLILVHRTVRSRFGDGRWAIIATILLATSVPFLLYARQNRYYGLGMLLAMASLAPFANWPPEQTERGKRAARFTAAVAIGLMFHTSQLLFLSYVPALLSAHLLVGGRLPSLRTVAFPSLLAIAIAAPGLLVYRTGQQGGMLDPTRIPQNLESHLAGLLQFMIPLPILAALLLRWGWLAFWKRRLAEKNDERFVLFLLLVILGNILALLAVPQCFHRYLAHLYPLCAMVLGWVVMAVWRFQKVSGALLGALLMLTNWVHIVPMDWLGLRSQVWWADHSMLTHPNVPLRLYLNEIAEGYPDVNQRLIDFFRRNADSVDTVLITYGDLPLQFYTQPRVVGGLQGWRPARNERPEWVVKRFDTRTNREGLPFSGDSYILNELDLEGNYRAIELPYADERFGNRPDPEYHRFLPPTEPYPKLTVHRLDRRGGR